MENYIYIQEWADILFQKLETPKRELHVWQIMKTQMKCRFSRHYIKVCTVCLDKIDLQKKET